MPAIRMASQVRRHAVRVWRVAIARYLEAAALMLREHRRNELPHRMIPKIARNVADPELPAGIRIVPMRTGIGGSVEPLRKSPMLGIDVSGLSAQDVVERKQQGPVGIVQRGLQGQRLA